MRIADPRSVRLLITDADLQPVIPTVTDWTTLDCTVKLNDTGVGTFTAPVRSDLVVAATTAGHRVHLYLAGQPWICGPIEVPGAIDRSGASGGTITVSWASDFALLGWRLVYPNPASAADSQGSVLRYSASGPAESVMRTLVDLNAGAGALTDRSFPRLSAGTDTGLGATATVSSHFDPLVEVLRTAAVAGGGLAFDVVLNDLVPELEFVVRAPADLSTTVVYSEGLGNLRAVKTSPASPTATVAIAGYDASADTPDTTVVESGSASPWGRIETWVSGTTLDSGATTGAKQVQLAQDGVVALSTTGPTAGISATVADTDGSRYGVAYQLGDTVGVRPVAGSLITDVVTAVTLTGTPTTGLVESPVIGTGSAETGVTRVRVIRELARRLGRQERG